MVDPNNENKEHGQEGTELVPFSQQDIETYIPDEILQPRRESNQRVGEVMWPQDRAGEMVRLSDELGKLRQNQLATIQGFEAGGIPNQLPMHDKVAEKYNELQMRQMESFQRLIDAQEKAKINETKAGNINAAQEVSEFNQKRLIDYSKAGAKSLGNMAKYIAIGTGATALWITKFGLEIGKETFKAGADIWYSLWGAHRDYKERYPNQNDI